MKNFVSEKPPIKHEGYRVDSRFTARTPLLPFEVIERWVEDLNVVSGAPESSDAAYAETLSALRSRLKTVIAKPEIYEALFIASPSLVESLPEWLRSPNSERGRKVEPALVRYLVRMASRPTPFGLFSGCSVGDIGASTELELVALARYRRHTRLDMDYLFSLCAELNRNPELRARLRYWPNSSLYTAANRHRYVEAHLAGTKRTYRLVALTPAPHLDAVLERARGGATLDELDQALRHVIPDTTAEERSEFWSELLDAQVLVSDLAPPVTGAEPIHYMIEVLNGIQALEGRAAETLSSVHGQLADIDAAGVGQTVDAYHTIAAQLVPLAAPVELPRLFQVDLIKPVKAFRLPATVGDDVAATISWLVRFRNQTSEALALKKFARAFEERFGGAEVPLCEALDEEAGIGFDVDADRAEHAPLLDGLPFSGAKSEDKVPWGRADRLLLRKLEIAWERGAQEITLDDGDLPPKEDSEPEELPNAFCATVALSAKDPEAVDTGDYRFLFKGCFGPSGMRMLGRFAHGDPDIEALVRSHLSAEEQLEQDAIFAEVAHLPDGRIGNVICRPVLRDYEIPFVGLSGAAREKQIPVTDLSVSIQAGRIALRSLRLNRRVIPRITNAHNLSQPGALAMYRFLGAMQMGRGVGWNWGALESARFLPRVRIGRAVVERARWILDKHDLELLAKAKERTRFVTAQQLRSDRRMPRFVVLADGDNELLVDFENPLTIEALTELVSGRSIAILRELYPTPDSLLARGPEGRFTQEIILSFVRNEGVATNRLLDVPISAPARLVTPGEDCLYLKFYGGTSGVERLLTETLAPLIRASSERGLIERWFFIRYGDPNWHLRLRFFGAAKTLHGELMTQVSNLVRPLIDSGAIWRVQADTYERELARYGGPHGIELAERVFHVDSEAVLEVLQLLDGDDGAEARWQLTLRGLDMLLDGLGLDFAGKREVLARARGAFSAEFGSDTTNPALKHALGARFRANRKTLDALFDSRFDTTHDLSLGLDVWRRRSERLAPIGASLRQHTQQGRLRVSIPELCMSYMHMFCNRMLRGAARQQELVLYDFLDRIYESQWARRRKAALLTKKDLV